MSEIGHIKDINDCVIIVDLLKNKIKRLICVTDDTKQSDLISTILKFFNIKAFTIDLSGNKLSSYQMYLNILEFGGKKDTSNEEICVILDKESINSKMPIHDDVKCNYTLEINNNQNLSHSKLLEFLESNGYENLDIPMHSGEYSVSGGIVNILVPNQDVVIDFIGNKVESIVINNKKVESVLLSSFSFFKEDFVRPLEYFDDFNVISISNIESNIKNIKTLDQKELCFEIPLFTKNKDSLKSLTDFIKEKISLKNRSLNSTIKTNLRKIIISAPSEGARLRLMNALKFFEINADPISTICDIKEVGIALLPIRKGASTKDFIIIGWNDIFPYYKNKNKKKQIHNNPIEPGNLVVHVDHGLGKFIDLKNVAIGSISFDCLEIQYNGNDKLLLPVENIADLKKYGLDSDRISLDKLGGNAWNIKKAAAKDKIKLIADELIKTAAIRKSIPGIKMDITNTDFLQKPNYHLTEDQINAISDIQNDLSSGVIMDRLICGDTGFGKTEIAIRAAAYVVSSGYQVAILVPTRLLCNQHFKVFKSRFPHVTVKKILGNQTNAEHIKLELSKGNIDIIIGTHSLMNVEFKNLGLFVVDEEHNFGVKQKEKLKQISRRVHMLSMSATPIPRTLQMSISMIKSMNIIATPPVDRKTVRTSVINFNEEKIKNAILNEVNRNGLVIYVCPRIKDIDEIIFFLSRILPDIKVNFAHGKMSSSSLDEIMNDFYEHKFGVLVATTIVESGLDIPDVNTIIVHNADMFGLSQLYQLRGRVGRRDKASFAIFTTEKAINSEDAAYKRLKVINSIKNSIALACEDMDMRGFGNLVGEKQSGQVKEIGVEIYQDMLKDAINAQPILDEDVKVEIQISRGIPSNYISDFKKRMLLYKEISKVSSTEEIDQIASSLIEEIGDMPEELQSLLRIAELKIFCRKIKINLIKIGFSSVSFSFCKELNFDINLILEALKNYNINYKLSPLGEIFLLKRHHSLSDALDFGIIFFEFFVNFIESSNANK